MLLAIIPRAKKERKRGARIRESSSGASTTTARILALLISSRQPDPTPLFVNLLRRESVLFYSCVLSASLRGPWPALLISRGPFFPRAPRFARSVESRTGKQPRSRWGRRRSRPRNSGIGKKEWSILINTFLSAALIGPLANLA